MSMHRCSFTLLNGLVKWTNSHGHRHIKRWVAPTLIELRRRQKLVGPLAPQHRNTYLEWNSNAELFAFGKRLNEQFDRKTLQQAFTHRSYVIQEEMKSQAASLDITVAQDDNTPLIQEGERFIDKYLQKKVPDVEPNVPRAAQQAVINYLTTNELLALVAKHIGVTDLILCSDFPVEEATMAGTFKAIVGALIRSSGEERAAVFVDDFVVAQLNGKDVYDLWVPDQPLLVLRQKLREMKLPEAEARLCGQAGTETILAAYNVGLYVDKKLIGVGWGESIDVAKDVAALDAIQRLYNNKVDVNGC